jgi:hypothetical protein
MPIGKMAREDRVDPSRNGQRPVTIKAYRHHGDARDCECHDHRIDERPNAHESHRSP